MGDLLNRGIITTEYLRGTVYKS